MEEIKIEFNVPEELNDKFESALSKVVKQFVRRIEFSMADEILSKSKLTDKQADELADEVSKSLAKRYEKMFSER